MKVMATASNQPAANGDPASCACVVNRMTTAATTMTTTRTTGSWGIRIAVKTQATTKATTHQWTGPGHSSSPGTRPSTHRADPARATCTWPRTTLVVAGPAGATAAGSFQTYWRNTRTGVRSVAPGTATSVAHPRHLVGAVTSNGPRDRLRRYAASMSIDSGKALAEPTVRVRGLFLATMALANLGIMLAFFTPILNLLPRMSEEIAGADGKGSGAGGGDGRGRHRIGDRQPLGGCLVRPNHLAVRAASALDPGRFAARSGGTVPAAGDDVGHRAHGVVAGRSVLGQRCLRGPDGDRSDQVPVDQRGVASGLIGLAQAIGPVIGVGLVTYVILSLNGGSYITAVLFVLFVLPSSSC